MWWIVPGFSRYETNLEMVRNRFTKRARKSKRGGMFALTNDNGKRKETSFGKIREAIEKDSTMYQVR